MGTPSGQGVPPPRLLVIGLHTAGSGLTSVGLSLASTLMGPFEVGYVGLERPDGSQRCSAWPSWTYVASLVAHGLRFSVDPCALDAAVEAFDPGHILVIGPPFLARPLLDDLQSHRPHRQVVLYAAIETDLTDPIVLDVFRGVDAVLTYSAFTEASIRALAGRLGRRDELPPIVHVGHGIATPERFRPLGRNDPEQRRRLRRQAFADHPDLLGDAFIVLNANRTYDRKRHDLSIEGFARFLRKTDAHAHLYLHALWISEEDRATLDACIAQAGVAERVHLMSRAASVRPLSDEALNVLYNATDVGLNTAMGEGWGLASFEHALTGAAQIVPAHTGLQEQWTGAAELVPTVSTHPIFYEYGTMSAVGAEGVATALERLYADRTHRDRLGDAGRRNALATRYTWASVAERMTEALIG